VGSNVTEFSGRDVVAVMIDGVPLAGFHVVDGRGLLMMNMFDENNVPVLSVFENQLVYSVDPWDIQLVGSTLTVRMGGRDIFIRIEFHPPDRVVVSRGRLLLNGVAIEIWPDRMTVLNGGNTFSGNQARDIGNRASVTLDLGVHPGSFPCAVRVPTIRRYVQP
jgi:hypothetical protein